MKNIVEKNVPYGLFKIEYLLFIFWYLYFYIFAISTLWISFPIEDMSLGLETGRESIDDSLLCMLPKLRKLLEVDIHTSIEQTSTIERICIMQLENKLGMYNKHVT